MFNDLRRDHNTHQYQRSISALETIARRACRRLGWRFEKVRNYVGHGYAYHVVNEQNVIEYGAGDDAESLATLVAYVTAEREVVRRKIAA